MGLIKTFVILALSIFMANIIQNLTKKYPFVYNIIDKNNIKLYIIIVMMVLSMLLF